jgi:hypothetical protein
VGFRLVTRFIGLFQLLIKIQSISISHTVQLGIAHTECSESAVPSPVSGLLYKIKQIFPIQYFRLLKSYLTDRKFRARGNGEVSNSFNIQSGVPQGSVLGPILYVLYTSDLPTITVTTTGIFADDTIILTGHEDPITAARRLQSHLDHLETWLKK